MEVRANCPVIPKSDYIAENGSHGSKSLFGYCLLLKIENWKHCNKIIFKCVNSAVWPIFNENFVEKIGL